MTDDPGFARTYEAVAAAGQLAGYGLWRREVLAPATGRLLLLGSGPGHDLGHLPLAVTCVVAVEPDRSMRARSRRRVAACSVPVTLVAADAHDLPLADGSVDAVLCSCVLCSVASPARVLAEVRRVLAPGGALLLLEHVAADPGTAGGRALGLLQRAVARPWARAAGGCSVRRDTRGAVAAAGFDVDAVRAQTLWIAPPPVAPHVIGRAVVR